MSEQINKKKNTLGSLFILFVLLLSFLLPLVSFGKNKIVLQGDETELASNDYNKTGSSLASYHSKLNSMKQNAESIRKKVSSARQKERVALSQLQKTQRDLYRIQTAYMEIQGRMFGIEKEIRSTKNRIAQINAQINSQSSLLKTHLRGIYIHKADMFATLADSLIESKSIVEFLNLIYYQKKIINQELKLISNIQAKQKKLKQAQIALRKKQEDISLAMMESQKLKETVARKKNEQFNLVDRLRKERLSYESAERQLERESGELTRKILQLSDGKGIGLDDLIKNYFDFPVRAAITSPFGNRMHPIFHVRSFHSGIDLGARYGTPIKASNGGLVIFSGWYSGYGKTVIVSHSNGKSTLYAHMERYAVKQGQKVYQGQTIGYVGSTGYSTGPHLHFEYRLSGKPQNPLSVLR